MVAHAETVLEDWLKVYEWIEYETWVSKGASGLGGRGYLYLRH